MTVRQRTERIGNVLSVLYRYATSDAQGLTLRKLSEKLDWVYGGENDGTLSESTWARDRDAMAEFGMNLKMAAPAGERGATVYWVEPGVDLHAAGLSDGERLALLVAAASIASDDVAIAPERLGGQAADTTVAWLADVPESLPVLVDAARRSRTVSFTYRNAGGDEKRRDVEPWGVLHQDGAWYLVGWDVAADGPRNFRVDRIVGGLVTVKEFTLASRPVPDGAVATALEADPKMLGVEPVKVAKVAVHPDLIPKATDPADGGSLTAEVLNGRFEGWGEVEVTYRDREQLRSWLLGFGDRAVLREPRELIDWFVDSLGGI